MPHPLIRTVNLCKSHQMGESKVHALRDLSIEIGLGEFVAIMGPSGSGKSTIMNLLGLLDAPSQGHYYFEGSDVAGLGHEECARLRSRRIGFVFQNFSLLGRNTALENVELPLVYAGIARAERLQRASRALERVGLAARQHHWPRQLSGGEQQRVAIARALANDPALILADEPTGALDSTTGRGILGALRELNDDGRTVIVVTHDSNVARYAKRVINIQDGRAISDAPTPDLADEAGAPSEWQAGNADRATEDVVAAA
ncbi:MAG: ABC transporter ATP-binding protein [Hyphomicrobiaceae bacterium]|nr:ABC transporter ATP-binding protein [Hyphomicrobiaceae bacterium]